MSKAILANIMLPEPDEEINAEEARIGYLLRQANTAHRMKVEQILAKQKITLPQFSVLTFCGMYPGLSNADLARLTGLTPQTVCVIVANLERKALITRHAHEIHGRIQHIELTEEGQNVLDKCNKPVIAYQNKLTAGLSPKEEKIIRHWLVRVAQDD